MKRIIILIMATFAFVCSAMDVIQPHTPQAKRTLPTLAALCMKKIEAYAQQEKEDFAKANTSVPVKNSSNAKEKIRELDRWKSNSDVYNSLSTSPDGPDHLTPTQKTQFEAMYSLLPYITYRFRDRVVQYFLSEVTSKNFAEKYTEFDDFFSSLSPEFNNYFKNHMLQYCAMMNPFSTLNHARSIETQPAHALVDLTIPATLTVDPTDPICKYLKSRLCCVSPIGNRVAVVDGSNTLHILKVSTNQITNHEAEFNFSPSIPLSCSFSYDGGTCAVGFNNTTITLINLRTTQTRSITHSIAPGAQPSFRFGITALVFSHDNSLLVSGSTDGSLRIWNAQTGKIKTNYNGLWDEFYSLDYPNTIRCIALSFCNTYLAAATKSGEIHLWNPENINCRELRGQHEKVNCLAFSPNNKMLISGSHNGTINMWNITNANLIRTLVGLGSPVEQVAFSPNGKTIMAYLSNGIIPMFTTNKQNGLQEALALHAFDLAFKTQTKQQCRNLLNHLFFATLPPETMKKLREKIDKM